MQVIAFYTDVFHEVLPVKTGYRVALTYHLWAVPKKKGNLNSVTKFQIPRPVSVPRDKEVVEALLRGIFTRSLNCHFNQDGADYRYAFALDHSYGRRNLSRWDLRGRDKLHYEVFLAAELPYATVSLEQLSVETFSKPKDVSQYKELQLVIVDQCKRDTSGASEQTVWLNQERFLSMNHEFEEYEYYTGNDGYATGLQYEHACIIIQPDGFELSHD